MALTSLDGAPDGWVDGCVVQAYVRLMHGTKERAHTSSSPSAGYKGGPSARLQSDRAGKAAAAAEVTSKSK
jgi:hypothetical protein